MVWVQSTRTPLRVFHIGLLVGGLLPLAYELVVDMTIFVRRRAHSANSPITALAQSD